MEDSVVAAYLSLLLGCILQENKVINLRIKQIVVSAYAYISAFLIKNYMYARIWESSSLARQ